METRDMFSGWLKPDDKNVFRSKKLDRVYTYSFELERRFSKIAS
jgi:hypothetical protein